MNYYLAKIVYQVIYGEGSHTTLFDEQLRLIVATNYDAAFIQATEFGENGSYRFYHQQQKLVEWKFINVSDLYSITADGDGTEMYSCIKEMGDASCYINEVNRKAMNLQQLPADKLLPAI